jgi:5S rRNA maturation endonuclease (ribonuclease M5)
MSKKSPEQSNPSRVLNAIGLKLSANDDLIFILVEGDTDKRFFKKIFDTSKVSIEITFGKQNLLEVIELLHQNKLGRQVSFFAIKDADFDRINQKAEVKNLYLTDASDTETTILNSLAFNSILSEYGQDEKIEGKNIVEILLNSAKILGSLRLINEREGLNLKFNELCFSKFVNKPNLKIDVDEMIKTVFNNSKRQDLKIEDFKEKINQILSKNHDLLQLCNGHDLVELLSISLTKLLGNKGQQDVKIETLESSLRISYRFKDFKLTKLCASIIEWEKENNKQVFR